MQREKLGLNFEYCKKLKQLYHNNNPVPLSKNEQKLFCLLLKNQDQIVHNKIVEEEVWSSDPVTDGNRRNLVYNLRKKLGGNFIETIPRVGVKLSIAIK